ncbi:MAG TPA: IS30 family transposase [Reyranella sp.]|nr:IS30 family transposase [Reyranella sp.]
MGRSYRQFSLEDRCELARLHVAGASLRQIAAALDRAPSSVSRELRRNSGAAGDYKPAYAGQQAGARRWRGSRLVRDADLRQTVLDRLGRGWSPQQVAGRLARDHGRPVISHETIYRFIAAQIARTKDYRWRLYLPRGKSKRGWRGRKGGSPAQTIPQRVPIQQRPATAEDRRTPGHWEADLMLFSIYGQAVLALHERTSRLLAIIRQPSKAASPLADTLHALLVDLPLALRLTITFDNGTEFALHHRLRDLLDIQTFFCDPHAPWQKGGIENAIGRLRRDLPRRTDLSLLHHLDLIRIARRYNHTPRLCLDFRTPAEVFSSLLHFKCESTSPLSRG